jgi:oxalate decarboxylase
MTLKHGGWSREVTIRELPVSTTMAGVNMALTPGGVRELHWHQQTEWAIMLVGRARITAVDQNGRNFIADVGVGDIWYFPPGIPHSIQGLAEGCEFLIVFDDGKFSEFSTLTISDWFAHTPKDVLSANFGVPISAFAQIPKDQRFIFQANVPGPLESQQVKSPYGTVPKTFTHRLLAQEPIITPGGTMRIVDSTNFPISTTFASMLMEIKPGATRELHWHPNGDEWNYVISGTGRMTVMSLSGTARTFNIRAGDVGYIPINYGHYIQNTGEQSLWIVELFKSDRFEDVSLNQWMALTPHQLVQENLNVGPEFINVLQKKKLSIVKFPGYTYYPRKD